MKGKIIKEFEVTNIASEHYEIKETPNGVLRINGKEINIVLQPDAVVVSYVEHRPNHDHNDRHSITIKIPEGGVMDPLPSGSRHKDLEFKPLVLSLHGDQNLVFEFSDFHLKGKQFRFWDVIRAIHKQSEVEK